MRGRWSAQEIGSALKKMLSGMMLSLASKNLRFMVANINPQDLTAIGELIEAGKVTPVIERRYYAGRGP